MLVLTVVLVLLLSVQHLFQGTHSLTDLYISQLKELPLGWLSYGALLILQAMLFLSAATMWRSESYGFSILYGLAGILSFILMVTDARSPDHVAAYVVLLVLVPSGYGFYFWYQERWADTFRFVILLGSVGCLLGNVSGPLLQKISLVLFLVLLNLHCAICSDISKPRRPAGVGGRHNLRCIT